MEKQPHHEYRDELAGKLKEIRNSDSEDSKLEASEHLEKEKETEEYKASLKLHQNDVERIITDKSVEGEIRESFILRGDAYLKEGYFKSAIESYEKAGAKDKLVEAADDFLSNIKYSNQGYTDRGRYTNTGQRDSYFQTVIDAYEKAGAKDKLMEVGNTLLRLSLFGLVIDAYEKAGAKDKLMEVGDLCSKKREINYAKEAYEKAKSL